MQKIIKIDSQILSSIQSCPRKTKYQFFDHLRPLSVAAPLERGSLMHDLIEIYYGIKGNKDGIVINENSETWKFLFANFTTKEKIENLHKIVNPQTNHLLADFVIQAGELRASKLQLGIDICSQTLNQFRQYADYYKNETWVPITVEETGAKVLYEDEDYKILYIFKIDRVMQEGNKIAIVDTKTGERNSTPSSMANQFLGYCWALEKENILIDKIGFQKTLKVEDRFKRYILPINQARIDEWVINSVYWIKRLLDHIDSDYWPMNISYTCSAFSKTNANGEREGGCSYLNLCEIAPDDRPYMTEKLYQISDPWDPSKHLGD